MVRLILDTDIGTDVDDALALAFAFRHPDIDLVAVTTVADDVVLRAHIASKLLRIGGRDDIEVAPGVGWDQSPSGRKSAIGHEGEGLIEPGEAPGAFERDAFSVLTEQSGAEIATIGMQSNIAAVLDQDAEFARRISRLDVMGGVFAPVRSVWGDLAPAADHNLVVDPAASLRSLNAGIPTMYVPLDVTVRAQLTKSHLKRLRGGDELCRALARLIDVWVRVARMPEDVVAILHDPLTVACTVDRRFVTVETLPVTVALHEGAVRTFIDCAAGNEAEVITSVDGPAFADYWLETVIGV